MPQQHRGSPVVEITPQRVKMASGMGGKCDKKMVVKMMSRLLKQKTLNNHIADAGGVCDSGLSLSVDTGAYSAGVSGILAGVLWKNIHETLERIEGALIEIDRRIRTVETVIAELRGRKSMLATIKDGLILLCVIVAAGCVGSPFVLVRSVAAYSG